MSSFDNDSFNDWLTAKMRSMNLDEDVYVSYIKSILDGEDSINEKIASIRDLVSDVSTSDMFDLSEEMCERYLASQSTAVSEEKKDNEITIESRLAFIMEKQAQSIQKVIKPTESEKELKEAILAQYAQISDDESSEDPYDECEDRLASASNSIPQNTNVNAVIDAQKEIREKSKAEYDKKKAQDKLNRERQKQKQQERRERERKRTQKQEHRR